MSSPLRKLASLRKKAAVSEDDLKKSVAEEAAAAASLKASEKPSTSAKESASSSSSSSSPSSWSTLPTSSSSAGPATSGTASKSSKKNKKKNKKNKKKSAMLSRILSSSKLSPKEAEKDVPVEKPSTPSEVPEKVKLNSESHKVVVESTTINPKKSAAEPRDEKKVSFVDLPIWDSKVDEDDQTVSPEHSEPEVAGTYRPNQVSFSSATPAAEGGSTDGGSPIHFYGVKGEAKEKFLVSVESLGSSETTIFQDWLRVRAARDSTWKNRWVLIHNNVLYIFPSFDSSRPKSIVVLDSVMLEDCSRSGDAEVIGKHSFALKTKSGRALFLQADSAQMKNQWIELLTSTSWGKRSLNAAYGKRSARQGYHSSTLKQNNSVNPTSMVWSVFVLLQVLVQISLEIAFFIKNGKPSAEPLFKTSNRSAAPSLDTRRPSLLKDEAPEVSFQ